MSNERFARIASVGSALPHRVVPNEFFESLVETSDEWIIERTGIHTRRFAGPGETTSTLSVDAATRALGSADWDPSAVDLLIVATCTPDRPLPSTAAFVQAKLGMSCAAFDLNAACAGFVYGLLAMDGTQAELLTIPAGGSEQPATAETAATHGHQIHMQNGQTVFHQAVVGMAAACASVLEKAGLSGNDVTIVIAHQANARIIAAVGKRLGIDPARVVIDVAEVCNTSAASIPIAMDRAWKAGRLHPGDLVLTAAFGAGLAWGANLIRWTAPAPSGAGA